MPCQSDPNCVTSGATGTGYIKQQATYPETNGSDNMGDQLLKYLHKLQTCIPPKEPAVSHIDSEEAIYEIIREEIGYANVTNFEHLETKLTIHTYMSNAI